MCLLSSRLVYGDLLVERGRCHEFSGPGNSINGGNLGEGGPGTGNGGGHEGKGVITLTRAEVALIDDESRLAGNRRGPAPQVSVCPVQDKDASAGPRKEDLPEALTKAEQDGKRRDLQSVDGRLFMYDLGGFGSWKVYIYVRDIGSLEADPYYGVDCTSPSDYLVR